MSDEQYGIDPSDYEDQLQPEDTLDGAESGDVLDHGYSPPDSARGSSAHGVTAHEQSVDETIEERILQEEPDPNSAAGAPLNESGLDTDDDLDAGTSGRAEDDPDLEGADNDWDGDAEVGSARAGRLVAPDEGAHEDSDAEPYGRDVGIDGAGASAEEAAMHVIDE
ncbi:DUF5709 domain-containing protein [Janibacter sp. G56]|uniref:DUF5709 domain-containing protein n=1 Tax=Janibacter sp. G56 TaxID=3418717 RepID=UPI003D02566E